MFAIQGKQLLAYADDIGIIGRVKRDVTAAISSIKHDTAKMGRVILVKKKKKDEDLISKMKNLYFQPLTTATVFFNV